MLSGERRRKRDTFFINIDFFKCRFWNPHISKRKESSLPTPKPNLHTKTKLYLSSEESAKFKGQRADVSH